MKDKVVIITGGSSGIGKALAEEFGLKGAKIVITGRREEALQEVAEDLRQQSIEVLAVKADVSVEEDNRKMVEAAVAHFHKVDILINNAGISMRAPFQDVAVDVIKKVMDINFWGAVYATKYALPHILKSKGSVVGISSIAGYRGLPGRVGYSASKFALQGFLEVLRTEMLKTGVHVLTVCPGFTTSNIRKTSLTQDGSAQGESPRDEGKMMSAEECAAYIYKAVRKRRKILVLTNLGKFTVIMNKFFPGFMDRITYNVMAKEENSPFK